METTLLVFIPGIILICATEKEKIKVILREIYRKQHSVTQLNIILSMVFNPLKDREQ